MFRVQCYDSVVNQFHTFKFKIVENDAGGDCLFKTIHAFLRSNKLISGETHKSVRGMIVQEAVKNLNFLQIQEIKFNLEHHVNFFSTVNLDDFHSNFELQQQCSVGYSEYMSAVGSYGTLFELAISTHLFGYVAVVFMKQGDIFKCFDIGYTNKEEDDRKPKLFILFTGSTRCGHFRFLKPSSVECLKSSDRIARGDYSIFKEDPTSFHLKKGLVQISDSTQSHSNETAKNDSGSLACPFCIDSLKKYKGQVGLEIHISRMHPGESYKPMSATQEKSCENLKICYAVYVVKFAF